MTETVREVLLHKLPAGVYVEITDGGWRIGFTYIDHEDLFIHSLNPRLLEKTVLEVKQYSNKDFYKPIYEIKIK